MPDRCFCECVRDGVVRQPANTWSNLAFVLVGILVVVKARRDLRRDWLAHDANPMRTEPIYPTVYATATILVGVGSFFYHLSLAFVGQVIDVISMYLVTAFILLYNLARLTPMDDNTFSGAYILVNLLLGYLSVRWPVLRRYIFVALLLGTLLSEVVLRRKLKRRLNATYLVVALVCLFAALACWILDITGVVCAPESAFQGHALWHVLMAGVIWLIYLYYRSEIVGVPTRAPSGAFRASAQYGQRSV